MNRELKFKICLFGDFAVGKTTLAHRYLTNLFHPSTILTLGMEMHIKNIDIEEFKIVLAIWDFGGQRRFRYLLPSYARGSFGSIFMYDITNKDSVTEIEDWLKHYREGVIEGPEMVPCILVGGKLDLNAERQISKEEGLKIAEKFKFFKFIECSSKTGENVEEIFEILVREIMRIRGFL